MVMAILVTPILATSHIGIPFAFWVDEWINGARWRKENQNENETNKLGIGRADDFGMRQGFNSGRFY